MTKKNKISFILNLFIFILVLPDAIVNFTNIPKIGLGLDSIKYFTVQSNIFAGIVSLIFIIYYILIFAGKKAEIPKFVYVLKFIVTIDLILTFCTVLFYLAPTIPTGFLSMYNYTNFFFHFLIPVLAVVSFIFFENKSTWKFWITLVGIGHMFLYGVAYLITSFANFGNAELLYKTYDWYGFSRNGTTGLVITMVLIFVLTYMSSLFV